MSKRDRFNEFWLLFISTHLNPWNRKFHAFGNVWMAASFALFAWKGNWIFLLLSLCGYFPSWVGHFLFEGNVPVTFYNPFLSALCDLKLMGLMVSGELPSELERLFGTSTPKPGAPLRVTKEEEKCYQNSLRYRIREDIGSHPFKGYWEIFVLKHQRPANVWIHVIAMFYLYALLALTLWTRNWRWLILVPLSQLAGLISHAIFERTHIDFEDALFSKRAFYCLNRLMLQSITGSYWKDLARMQERLEQWRRNRQ